jgi:pantoate--beta-alanine ligase
LRLIEQLVRDLNMPTEIVGAPIVREPDGLAMSSRNVFLSPAQRQWAPSVYRALQAALAQFRGGERDAGAIMQGVRRLLDAADDVVLDYVELVSWDTLQPMAEATPGALLAVALRLGKTRLIDNVRLNLEGTV